MKHIRSMTGFGNAESSCEKFTVKVELKGLNGKYLELSTRLPRFLGDRELELRQHFQKRLNRGTIQLSVWMEKSSGALEPQTLNIKLAEHYLKQFRSFCDTHHLAEQDLFRSIITMPDIMKSEEVQFGDDDWKIVLDACEQAWEKFDAFRLQEGNSTARELISSLNQIEKHLKQLEQFEEERIQNIRERIQRGIDNSGLAEETDKNRFEQEMIYYLEKLDISEEKSRLSAHVAHFQESMDQPASGKTLGFIAQELGREINTIGSKSNHAEMQKSVVAMKDELEKIKEQVLNIL